MSNLIIFLIYSFDTVDELRRQMRSSMHNLSAIVDRSEYSQI